MAEGKPNWDVDKMARLVEQSLRDGKLDEAKANTILKRLADLESTDDPDLQALMKDEIEKGIDEAVSPSNGGGESGGAGQLSEGGGEEGGGGEPSDSATSESNDGSANQPEGQAQPNRDSNKKNNTTEDQQNRANQKKTKGDDALVKGKGDTAKPEQGKSATPDSAKKPAGQSPSGKLPAEKAGGGPAPQAAKAGGGGKAGGALAKAELAKEAAGALKTAKEEGLKAGAQQAAKAGVEFGKQQLLLLLLRTPWFWIILAALILLLLIGAAVYMFMLFMGKSIDLAGGSAVIPMKYPEHQALQESVKQAVASDHIVFADNSLRADIEWKTRTISTTNKTTNQVEEKDEKYMVLDWRTMVTLDYLAKKWDRIRVSLLYSNGPDYTRRSPIVKIGSVIDSEKLHKLYQLFVERDASAITESPLTAISGYKTGQAIGIDQIGWTSPGLTAACFGGIKKPVQVGWQRIIRLDMVRILYEQMQTDDYHVYELASKLNNKAGIAKNASDYYKTKAAEGMVKEDGYDTLAMTGLDNLITELTRAGALISLDIRTLNRFAQAKAKLVAARDFINSKEGVERLLAWGDEENFRKPLLEGLDTVYKGMQVANMGKWRGSITAGVAGVMRGGVLGLIVDECKFWKAYEARMNVRQMELDLLQMPFDPEYAASSDVFAQQPGGVAVAYAAADDPAASVDPAAESSEEPRDNEALQVKQLIVYSPEDDLDNGISEFDVYPNGATSVNEGGVGYDGTARDGKIDWRDLHFMSPPVDNGVFSRPGTIFVYKKDNPDAHTFFGAIKAMWDAEVEWAEFVFDDLWTGAGLSIGAGEDVEKVSYRNFVHIGF